MRRMFLVVSSFALLGSLLAKVAADRFLDERIPIVSSFAGLQLSFNRGIAFGITMPPVIQASAIAAAVILLFFVALHTAKTSTSQIGFGLILGGALGNIFDRMLDGLVTDFFQVGTFPIFNVGDSCITIGVITLLLEMLFSPRSRDVAPALP